jgi:hypothetical protein
MRHGKLAPRKLRLASSSIPLVRAADRTAGSRRLSRMGQTVTALTTPKKLTRLSGSTVQSVTMNSQYRPPLSPQMKARFQSQATAKYTTARARIIHGRYLRIRQALSGVCELVLRCISSCGG